MIKRKGPADRMTIIIFATIVALVLFSGLAYFFGASLFSTGNQECYAPSYYPDPSDRRGVRPACATTY